MKRIVVEVSDELHARLKMDALMAKKTLKQYILELVDEKENKKKE